MTPSLIDRTFSFWKKYGQVLLFVLFLWYGLFLRLDRLDKRELWNDEFFQIHQIQADFGKSYPFLSRTTTYGDHTSYPGEYLLTGYFLKKYGVDKWKLAIPHLAVVLLGMFFLFLLMKRYIRTPMGWLFCLTIFMINGNLVYYAFEYRPYAVLPTLSLGMLWWAHRIFEAPVLRWPERIIISLFMFGCGIYHAYGILFVLLPIGYLAGVHYWKERDIQKLTERLGIFWVPLVLTCLAWGWYASANATGALVNSKVETFQYIHNPLLKPWKFFKGTVGNITGDGYDWMYPMLLAPTVMTWVRHRQQAAQNIFLVVLVIVPFAAILAVDVLSRYWFLQRQFVWIIPLWALYIGWCWDSFYDFVLQKCVSRSKAAA